MELLQIGKAVVVTVEMRIGERGIAEDAPLPKIGNAVAITVEYDLSLRSMLHQIEVPLRQVVCGIGKRGHQRHQQRKSLYTVLYIVMPLHDEIIRCRAGFATPASCF